MINRSSKPKNYFLLLAIVVSGCFAAYSATVKTTIPASGTRKTFFRDTINIISANTLSLQKENDSTNLMIAEGNVIARQGNTIFKADKAIKNERLNTFEAWGHVHINDADTTNIYADHLKYFGNPQIANLDGNVKLTDGQAVLTTPSLEYNMNTNIGTYKQGGKVVNKKTVITSKEGLYYSDIKDVYFKKNVIVTDPAYHITTDSLQYNTGTQIATFIAMTHIKDSARRSINTSDGYYNLKTGVAEFKQRSSVYDADRKTTVTGNELNLSDSIAKAEGNAIVTDSIRGTIIIANLIFQNRINEALLATQKPVMIIRQDNDSIYVAADTLFSAKLTDLFETNITHTIDTTSLQMVADSTALTDSTTLTDSTIAADSAVLVKKEDSVKKTKTNLIPNKSTGAGQDSTNRYFEAFHNVRIYSDSMQAISDSLFYSFKDSTFRLYKRPVVWGKESQITGDTILLHTKNKQPHWMEAFKNGFMINSVGDEAYNQIKSSRIDAYFVNGALDSVRAKGSAECIYYIQDDDSSFTGINQNTCDVIYSYFRDKQLYKVAFVNNVDGTIYPVREKKPSEMKLEGFIWREEERPKTKYELFE